MAVCAAGAISSQGAVQAEAGKNHARKERGQAGEVEAMLKQAVASAPDSFEANHRLGEFYLQAGKLKTGIPYLEKAQRLNPAHYVNGYDLSLAYLETGDFANAARQIRELLGRQRSAALDPKLPDPHLQLGILYAGDEKYEEASREFRQAIRLKPDLADAHYRLGQAYSRIGNKTLAAKEFELYQRFHQQEMAEDEKRRNEAAALYFKM
jgi:tetratricopeptide (TPR) repeat protein